MRYRSMKYIYAAGILLILGNLLSACVVFIHIDNTTHFVFVNPLTRMFSRKDTECHRKRNENTVNITRASFFSRRAIFFHSTSCNKIVMDYYACALEAAAKLHPEFEVCLLYTSPVSQRTWSDHLNSLVKYDNFRLVGVHIESYADGTEFEEFWKRVVIHSGILNHEEITEYIKFLTLHKFGGIVLQLDVIITKPLSKLGKYWMVKNEEGLLATDAISISRSDIGRNITGNILRLLSKQILKGSINSSAALNTALLELCPGYDIKKKKPRRCLGFDILEDKLFHPISPKNAHLIYEAGTYDTRAFAHRLWNIEHAEKVASHKTLYADVAQNYCPSHFMSTGRQRCRDCATSKQR